MSIDDYRLPEAFKKAWRAEFRAGSEKHLAYLLRWIRHVTVLGLEGRKQMEKVEREFNRWMLASIRSSDAKARIYKLLRALDKSDKCFLPLTTKAITLEIYFELVRGGQFATITKKLLWDHVELRLNYLGLPVPDKRLKARILNNIGLSDLPQARAGRHKKELVVQRGS